MARRLITPSLTGEPDHAEGLRAGMNPGSAASGASAAAYKAASPMWSASSSNAVVLPTWRGPHTS
jgi:hypothetical protein